MLLGQFDNDLGGIGGNYYFALHLLKSFIAKSATIFSHIHIAWYAHFPHIALFFSLMPDCRQSTMQIKLVLVTLILQSLGWWLTHFLFCKLVSDETDYMYLKQSWWIQMIVYHRFFQMRKTYIDIWVLCFFSDDKLDPCLVFMRNVPLMWWSKWTG